MACVCVHCHLIPREPSTDSSIGSSLQTSALKIALVESQSLTQTPIQQGQLTSATYSNRCSSLTPASVRLFQDIGAWQHVDISRIQPYDSMRVWDGVTGSSINFDWTAAGPVPPSERTIAHMAENSNIVSALLARVNELGNVHVHDSTRVESINLGEETETFDMRSWPIVTLSNGQTLAARLLIGADGANSPVRTFAGIPAHGWDYDRHGVVATLKLADQAGQTYGQGTAYQRFLPSGPCALLPLPDGNVSLVWSTTPSHAALLKTLESNDLVALINAAFRLSPVDLEYMHTISRGQQDEYDWRIQHTPFSPDLVPPEVASVQPGSVASFPLRMRHADTYTGERVALVGDAAHTMHPLAGQGLNSGLLDVASLLGVVERAVESGSDIGSTLALEDYNTERYAANHVLLGAVDKLHKLYSWESGPVVWGRSLGLRAVDSLESVKGWLMRRAAGS